MKTVSRGAMASRWAYASALLAGDTCGVMSAVPLLGWIGGVCGLAEAAVYWAALAAIGLWQGWYGRRLLTPREELALLARANGVLLSLGVAEILVRAAMGGPARGLGWVMVGVWAMAWVPVGRGLARLAAWRWLGWGRPTVIVGEGEQSRALQTACRAAWSLALKVMTPGTASVPGAAVAVVAWEDWPAETRERVVATAREQYGRVLVVKGGGEVTALWEACEEEPARRPGEGPGGGAPGRRIKEAVERLMALAGGLVGLPVALAVAMAIRLESGGPVLFRQVRVGRGGEWFTTYKFRTMCEGAESQLEAILARDPELHQEYQTYRKLRRDPRVTRVGRLLRRWSLDELPQLWNVLRGDMCLVGPRAYLPLEVEQMGQAAATVLAVKPGITGIWQVHGRSQVPFAGRVRMDAYYVCRWTPWLDAYLLARTAWVVVAGRGAC